jgi:hypothetical protein
MEKFLQSWITVYDKCENAWHSIQASKMISNFVVLFFLIGIIITLLSHYELIAYPVGKFFAIELAFSILLISEILGLVFILTHSVADSIGKQFEIISLILLRDAFKEMGHLPLDIKWSTSTLLELLPLMTDAIGAVVIFLIIGLFYKAQRHVRITNNPQEQIRFILLKKTVANVLLMVFLSICIYDIIDFFINNHYQNTFNLYYTILIFTDILILIISLRYSNLYVHLFRYSSFALATVIIRLSLSAPKFYNVLLSVSAGLFVLMVTNIYNMLNKNEVLKKIGEI